MVEMLFGGMVLITCLGGFIQTFNWAGFTRGYLNLYGGVIESCVTNFLPSRPGATPYFDEELVNVYLPKYIDMSMRPYTVSLSWKVAYSDYAGAGEYHHMVITFDANLGLHKVKKTAAYSIKEVS